MPMGDALVALVSALLGAIVGGVVTAKVTTWTARRQLTLETRARLYLEVVPAVQVDVVRRWGMVKDGQTPPRLDSLLEHFAGLHRLATVAGSEDRRQVDAMRRWIDELLAIDGQLWWSDSDAWGVLPSGLQEVAAQTKEPLNSLSVALHAYGEWLSTHID